MINKKEIDNIYKQNLNDIIYYLSQMKIIDLRKAMNIYYSNQNKLQMGSAYRKFISIFSRI